MHEFHQKPPENFIAQIAFTQLNQFILTTDGRVFSWGSMTSCLGRDIDSKNESLTQEEKSNFIESIVGEVEFPFDQFQDSSPIVQIATGKSHVMALDTNGKIYAWG